ncbi:MAG: hypothetical protein HY560_14555, partial [Gemmatimonadetes bacterium]|nr:hypothetical protein [Gemmatimonadota bacterium]
MALCVKTRKACKLRERGVTLADLVRESIDRRFEQVSQRGKARDVTAILRRIFE